MKCIYVTFANHSIIVIVHTVENVCGHLDWLWIIVKEYHMKRRRRKTNCMFHFQIVHTKQKEEIEKDNETGKSFRKVHHTPILKGHSDPVTHIGHTLI